MSGEYRKGYSGCQEHFEDLQHDLAVIGQIAGLTATLRRSYQVSGIFVFCFCLAKLGAPYQSPKASKTETHKQSKSNKHVFCRLFVKYVCPLSQRFVILNTVKSYGHDEGLTLETSAQ